MILGIIPARYASTRFPGKPLALIKGKPMIQRVYEQVKKCSAISKTVVATDDERIESAVKSFGGDVIMTSENHNTGTERCAEAISNLNGDYDVVINIQGDEPFIIPEQIETLCKCFNNSDCRIATLRKKIAKSEELFNTNVVKVVVDENENALYFSRAPIPHMRNATENYWLSMGVYYKHIGIYGYRKEVLQEIVKLPVNNLEKYESLEQLRWLANGYKVGTAITFSESLAIDTIEDLQRAERFYEEK